MTHEVFEMTASAFLDAWEANDDTWMAEAMHEAFEGVDTAHAGPDDLRREAVILAQGLRGWYHWACEPGCLPDTEPYGPFPTQEDAEADVVIDDLIEDQVDDDSINHAAIVAAIRDVILSDRGPGWSDCRYDAVRCLEISRILRMAGQIG